MNIRCTYFRGQCDEACFELVLDPVPKQTIFNILHSIGRKPITYENVFAMKNRGLKLEIQVNYVEDVIIKRDKENHGMSRKEMIQFISDLSQEKSFVQVENHLD